MQGITAIKLFPINGELPSSLPLAPLMITAIVKVTSKLSPLEEDIQKEYPTWKLFCGDIEQWAVGENRARISIYNIDLYLLQTFEMRFCVDSTQKNFIK